MTNKEHGRLGSMARGVAAAFMCLFAVPMCGAASLDGRFEDWPGSPIAAWVKPGGPATDTPKITRLAAYADAQTVWLDVGLWPSVALQTAPYSLSVRIDADGDPNTGRQGWAVAGVDLAIEFSPARRGSHIGARVITYNSTGHGETASDFFTAGIASAPTVTANRFEVKVDRWQDIPGAMARFLRAGKIRICAALSDEGGSFAKTPALEVTLPPREKLQRGDAAWVDRPSGDVRILSWNVSRESILHHTAAFLRIFQATQADILLLDEVSDRVSTTWLAKQLASVGSGTWHIARGDGGGSERGMIASRYPAQLVPELRRIAYPESVRSHLPKTITRIDLPATGFVVNVGPRRLMLATVDLMCCGANADDPKEKLRELQAATIRGALQVALEKHRVDGLIVAGDFNLVVTKAPLLTLSRGLDTAGGDLAHVMPRQPDPRLVSTWRNPGDIFGPGLLDFQLYTASRLEPVNSVIFAPEQLSRPRRQALGLKGDEGLLASDHLPIVTEFRWRDPVPAKAAKSGANLDGADKIR